MKLSKSVARLLAFSTLVFWSISCKKNALSSLTEESVKVNQNFLRTLHAIEIQESFGLAENCRDFDREMAFSTGFRHSLDRTNPMPNCSVIAGMLAKNPHIQVFANNSTELCQRFANQVSVGTRERLGVTEISLNIPSLDAENHRECELSVAIGLGKRAQDYFQGKKRYLFWSRTQLFSTLDGAGVGAEYKSNVNLIQYGFKNSAISFFTQAKPLNDALSVLLPNLKPSDKEYKSYKLSDSLSIDEIKSIYDVN